MSNDSFDQSTFSRLIEPFKKNPVPIIGTLTFLTVGAFGAYRYRKKGTITSKSLFILQLRVVAQGTVIVGLMGAMGYHMYKTYMKGIDKNKIESVKH